MDDTASADSHLDRVLLAPVKCHDWGVGCSVCRLPSIYGHRNYLGTVWRISLPNLYAGEVELIEGWDNAPLRKVYAGLEPKSITLIYPYYSNPLFLRYQLGKWCSYPSRLREYLSAIIVDDGSPRALAEHVLELADRPFPIRLFYIEVDVPWNWLAARNIAMKHAPDGWCLGTDMDHVVPRDTLEALIWGQHDESVIYRFSRIESNGNPVHPHPNSWFMTKEMFWKFGGYDEALSGHYGTDGDARRRWAKLATIYTLPEKLIRHEHSGDSSTQTYKRKLPEDAKAVSAIVSARGKNWKPRVLSFPYHEVELDGPAA